MKVAGSKWRLLCAAGIKRSNSHDCRKLKFISKAHSPSHWTHASSSWGWSATDECVHVHVYDYIMHIHREIRWQTRQKQRGDKQPRLWCLKDSATFLRSDWLIKKFRTSTSHRLSELIVKQATFIYYWWTDAWLLFWILSPNPSLLSHFGCCLFVSSPFLAVTDICSPWDQVHRTQGAKGPLNPSHLLRDFW